MNLTNDTNSGDFQHDPWFFDPGWNWFTWNIFVWLFPVLCLEGAIANACSFYVIVSNRKSFPYATRQYLIIITLSDFLILTCKASTHYFGYMARYVRQNAWTWYKSPRVWGFGWCVVYDFVTFYATVGCSFFQLGLTVDRLVAVAAPLKAKMILSHKRSWALLGLIAAMAFFLPTLFVSNRVWNYTKNVCEHRKADFYDFVYVPIELYFGRVFLISSLILGTISISLLLAWNNRAAQKMQSTTSSSYQQQQQNNRERQRCLVRISLMLVFINILLLCTHLPWSILATLQTFRGEDLGEAKVLEMIIRHCNSVFYLNNALSWPVYFMGRNFRQAFSRIFLPTCLRSRGRGRGGQQSYRARTEAGGTATVTEDFQLTTGSVDR